MHLAAHAVAILCLSASWLHAQPAGGVEIIVNGGAEEGQGPLPDHWSTYGSSSAAEWGLAGEAHTGQRCVYLKTKQFTDYKGRQYINAGVFQGYWFGRQDETYRQGQDTVAVVGQSPRYRFSLWVKGDTSRFNVNCRAWNSETKQNGGATLVPLSTPNAEWTHYEGKFSLSANVDRFAILFQVWGYEDEGLKLGTIYVDDVSVLRLPGSDADDLPRITFPARPRVTLGGDDLEALGDKLRRKDPATVRWMQSALTRAEEWRDKPDAYYRNLISIHEPLGIYSVCCPIHPFRVRYYNQLRWSIKDPWRAYCPLCEKEGREYPYYPNPRYPDEGLGCRPTDAVWREDHDEAWSRSHQNIPHDHWDGKAHGYLFDAHAFHFTGNCQHYILRYLTGTVVPALATAYHLARMDASQPADVAEQYAHKAKVILLTVARAHLGDAYLADVLDISPAEFGDRMRRFYVAEDGTWVYREYPGYRRFTLYDWVDGVDYGALGIKPPRSSEALIYRGTWNMLASVAQAWVQGYGMVRPSFTSDEEALGVRDSIERMITSCEGDSARLIDADADEARRLKRGLLEYTHHPYELVAAGDNLAASTQMPRLELGLLLQDDKIVENVARDTYYFMRNHFTGDGMGPEGSPSYTSWGMVALANQLHGLKGDFDRKAAWYDEELGGLNLWQLPELRQAPAKRLFYLYPDLMAIPWEDSVYKTRGVSVQYLQEIEDKGGGIPKDQREFFDIKPSTGGTRVSVKPDVAIPSRLLHENRKGVMRIGEGRDRALAAVDYGKVVGHYHYPPFNLSLYAKGQELANDLGYLGASHHLTRGWLKHYEAHNTCTIRLANGDPTPTSRLRGDIRTLFEVHPGLRVMDVAEEDAGDLAAVAQADAPTPALHRVTALVAAGVDTAYVFDVFRTRGGALHDWYFHAQGETFETTVPRTPVGPPEKTLYEFSGFSYGLSPDHGARNVHTLSHGVTGDSWSATWRDVIDWRPAKVEERKPDGELGLKLTMLGSPDTQIITGRAPAQRFMDNRDYGREMTVLCARRTNSERPNVFAGVIEPFRGETRITSLEALALSGAEDGDIAAEVTIGDETHYWVSAPSRRDTEEMVRIDDPGLATNAELAFVSRRGNATEAVTLMAGTQVRFGDLALECGPGYSGALVDFDDARDTLTVQTQDELPLGPVLQGKTIVLQHELDKSTFSIDRVEPGPGGRFILHLSGTPHLAANYLLVKQVGQDELTVEPRPVLPSRHNHFVYADQGGDLRPLGKMAKWWREPIRDEWGRTLTYRNKLSCEDIRGIEPGDEVALSLLRPGTDTFHIAAAATLKRRMPDVFRLKTSGSLSLTLAPDVSVGLVISGDTARLTVKGKTMGSCSVKAAGPWHECPVGKSVDLPVAELVGGELTLVTRKPADMNLADDRSPEIQWGRADGRPLPASGDLGLVATPPTTLDVAVADALNAIDPSRLWLTCDGVQAPSDRVRFTPNAGTGRRGTVTCDLDGLFARSAPGVRQAELSVYDTHFDTEPARLVVRFRTEADHVLQDGTKVVVDSALERYDDLSVLFDGEGMPPGVTTYGRTWASEETPVPHWIELVFPRPREVCGLELQWANYQDTWWTSARYDIEARVGGTWRTVLQVRDNPQAPSSSHRFGAVQADRIRIVVPVGGGHPKRPDIFWPSEVTVW